MSTENIDETNSQIGSLLATCEQQLTDAGIATARLDALVLLASVTGKDKSWLLAYPEYVLPIESVKKLNTLLAQRLQHTPLAYLLGEAEFYGRPFTVSPDVLIPRPESESIIDLLLRQTSPGQPQTIIDIGTGSGALAITTKLELPAANVTACDISSACLKIAEHNAIALQADVSFRQGNLLEPVVEAVQKATDDGLHTTLLLNLPYVPVDYPVNQAASHEPTLALFGGHDGLDYYRQLFTQIDNLVSGRPAYIIAESLSTQHALLADLALCHEYIFIKSQGLAQVYKDKTHPPHSFVENQSIFQPEL